MNKALLRILVLFLFAVFSHQTAKACHGLPLVGYSAVVGPTGVTINASSDPATCGCGPYWLEVEVTCLSVANFTGNAPAWNATNWNLYPWYHASLNVPTHTAANGWVDNCVLEPYNSVFVPFTDLCPGTTYFLRSRERICGPGGGTGPWTAATTFTTPGTPPVFVLSSTASTNNICPGQPITFSANLTPANTCGSSGNTVYTWTTVPVQPGTPVVGTTVTISPTVSCVVTLNATGGPLACYTTPPATQSVTVTPAPTVGTTSVSPTTVCQGSCVTLNLSSYTNGSIQWQSSPNGITWTNIAGATTNPYQYCPVNSLMYFRAMVDGACTDVFSNIVTVGIIPTPNVNITATSTSICAGQNVTLTATGATSYQWNGGNFSNTPGASQTVQPSVTTTYTVSGNPSSACPGTRTVTIVVNQPPQLLFSPPTSTICAGNAVTITCGSDTNTYNWNGGPGLTSLSPGINDSVSCSPSSTTTYNVTATSPAGCTANGTVTVTIAPSPTLIPSSDSLVICPNSPDTLILSGASTYTVSPMIGVTLLNANGSQIQFYPAASQAYWVTGTSGQGCIDSIPIYVTVANNLVIWAGNDDSICSGIQTQLTATGGNSYSWTANNPGPIGNSQTATPNVAPTTTTTYYVAASDVNGCTGADTVTIFIRTPPTVIAPNDTTLCAGATIILNPATGANNYVWTGSSIVSGSNTASPTVSPQTTTTYTVTGTDPFQCQDTATIQVTVNPLPNANAGADVSICDTCHQLSASGGNQYAWFPTGNLSSPAVNNPMACISTTTSYTVTVTDANGCVNTDDITITVYPALTVSASSNAAICVGGQTTISSNAGGGDGGPYNYVWTPAAGIIGNANQQSVNVSPAATTMFYVTVTDQCGSEAVVDSVLVTVNALPVLTVVPDLASGCVPLCVNFATNSQPAAVTTLVDFGDGNNTSSANPNHCYNTAGSYTITYTVTDVNGCSNTQAFPSMINAWPLPLANFTASPAVTSILNPLINFSPSGCVGCDSTWYTMGNPGDSSVFNFGAPFSFTYTAPGTYIITQMVSNQYGCLDSSSEVVIIEPDFSFYAPSAFSPNNDGVNDVFQTYGENIDPATYELYVFDRWGNLIYFTRDMARGWNGSVNNSGPLCQIDTYVWRVSFRDTKGDPHEFVKHVNLIR